MEPNPAPFRYLRSAWRRPPARLLHADLLLRIFDDRIEGEETLSFETQDVEIQDFVNRVKRRKKLKKLAGTAAISLAAAFAILVLAWLFGLV